MPTLGFPATLSMDIQVNYWSSSQKQFVAITSATATSDAHAGPASDRVCSRTARVFPFPDLTPVC